MDYKHGAYGRTVELATRASEGALTAPIYVGTAPVHTVAGGAANVNRPVLVRNFAECVEKVGYSDEWDKYTLCEAMYAHFMLGGIGPVILINVMDPATCIDSETTGSVSLKPADGRVTITGAGGIVLDSVAITGKQMGEDYTLSYDWQTRTLVLMETTAGKLGTEALEITYDIAAPGEVSAEDVIGATDGEGVNTGIYAAMNVYQMTGCIPSLMLAPGWSEQKAVHDAMAEVAKSVNGHWQMMIYTDLPILDDRTQMTLSGAAAWKQTNGYDTACEKTHFPRFKTRDGRIYHLSTLACMLKQKVDAATGGIPYRTASNTAIPDAQQLWFGADDICVDDETLNQKLNRNGITTAAFVGGQWVLWGAHMAAYEYGAPDMELAVADTTRMMMIHLCNDFQRRRAREVDMPMSRARLKAIEFEEQANLDALISIGALLYGHAEVLLDGDAVSDMVSGDYRYRIEITTVPLSKSLTAYVSWTSRGIETLIED